MVVFLLSLTVSAGILVPPQSPVNKNVDRAKANTYQFVPTSGSLITGTEQNANSLLAAAAEGVNTGSWKGTLADDNFHWQVTAADSGTPNLNMQLDLGTAKLADANKLIIQTEVDLDSASRLLKIQICDWVSSTSVDAAADSQCTTGGWRSLNTRNASNADVDIALTTGAAFQWHIFDGYFSSGTGGGTTVSTPLTNFTSSDTQPVRIRYWSDSDVVGSGDVAVDFLRAQAFVDSVYHPSGVVNQNGSGGALTGTYTNAHVVGNSATAQQSVTAGNAIRLEGAGTAGSVADYYLQFKNVKTYTGANTFYFKADYSCSAATAGLDHKFSLYNFATTTWTDFNSAVIACSTTDATNGWSIDSITPADYIDEASSDEVRVRFLGDLNSTTTLRIDFAYLMLGSVNADTSLCEVTWGTGTATNCSNTRTLNTPAGTSYFNNPVENRSATADNDYYPTDCVANTATAENCAASNISFHVTLPADAQVVVNHFASRHRGQLNSTNPDLLVQAGLRDYSGTPTSTSATGGWTAVGAASTAGTFAYTDSIIALAIGTYGNQTNPDDHIDTTNNRMNMRLRTSTNGNDSVTTQVVEWDFAFVSIGWVVDSSHPTRNYQFAPTSHTLATGTQPARNAEVAASAEGVNTGGFKGTLGDDNMHWMVTGTNTGGSVTNYDAQLNFETAKQNGANKIIVQAAVDLDAALAMVVQICDWVSSTSVDNAADSNCTTGGWRTLNSQNASNADVALTTTTNDTSLQWHVYDGYFTTGSTGGSPVSTPLTNFFHSTNGVKIRFYSITQSATDIAIDFVRIQPIIDTVYHPASFTNQTISGGNPTGTYANTHVVGNTTTAQQSVTAGDGVSLDVPGTVSNPADFYFAFTNVKTYSGMNAIYVKAEYYCSVSDAAKDHRPKIYNFTSAAWEDLTTAAIDCSTTAATNAWAKNNINIYDYLNGGELRVGWYRLQNSTDTVRLDYIYVTLGSTNADTADCEVTFGTGTATNCSNTRDLDGTGTASRFDNPAEDESATMGTGDSNAYYAFDNETTPDTTVEESTSSNISFPVTQPANSSVVGQNFASRFSGCGNTGNACGAATLTVQVGLKDYSGFNAAVGGWLQIGGTSASSTLAYTDTITAMTVAVYGQQANPEDYIDTADNKVNLRLRTTTPGTNTSNVTTVWDFAMVSLQWIEIGNTIDIAGSSSVSGATVAVAVDGLLQVGKTASTSGTCPCAWSITSVFVAGDRPVLVWHDGASDANESSGITVYDGNGNISGMQLTAGTFSVGSGDDQTVDSTDLVKFDNDADEDVMYKFVTTTLTVDATNTYASDTIDILSGDTLTIGGSETLIAYNLTINGTLTSGGASSYTVQGDWVNNGTFNEGTSTVTFNGTTSEELNSGCANFDTCTAQNFYNLTINKTAAGGSDDNLSLVTNHLRVTNTLTITDGELIQGTLNVRVEGSSAVSIAAAGTWTNVSTGDLKLGGTFVNAGTATFNSNNGTQCVDTANDIVISSTSGGSQRAWSGAGTFTLYNLDVTDMTDSSITAYTSTFSNTTWTEGSCGLTVSGICKQYDRTTDCADDGSNQIRVAVNGSLQAQVDTTVDGSWSVTGLTPPLMDDIITVFIDGNANDNEAVAVTKYDGSGNITGILLYQRHLTLGSDDNPTLSNADIDAYDNSVSGDEDIFFDIDANDDLTVDAVSTYTDEYLLIKSGTTYRPGSGGSSNVNTTHNEVDGTLRADGNTVTINGDYRNDGTLTADNSTFTFTATTTGRTLSGTLNGASAFYNLTLSGSGGEWTPQAALAVTNDLSVSAGTLAGTNNVNVTGTVTGAGTINLTGGTFTQSVGSNEDFGTSSGSNNWTFNNLTFAAQIDGQTITTVSGTGGITVTGVMTQNTGGSCTENNVNFNAGNRTWTLSGSGGAPLVVGCATFTASTSTFLYTGNNGLGNTTVRGLTYYHLTVNNSAETYVLGANTTVNQDLTVTAGTLSLNGFTASVTDDLTVDGTLSGTTNVTVTGHVQGTGIVNLTGGTFEHRMTLSGNKNFGTTSGSNAWTFSSLTFSNGSGICSGRTATTQTGGSGGITVSGILRIGKSGDTLGCGTTLNAGNRTWTLSGTGGDPFQILASPPGDLTPATSTFSYTGNNGSGDTTIQSETYNNLIINNGSETFNLEGTTLAVNVTITAGTLSIGSNSLTVTLDLTVDGTLSGTGTVIVRDDAVGTGTITLTGGTFEMSESNGGNFGTTSGSNTWTFNNLTFREYGDYSGMTITTQTGGSGGITVTGVLTVGNDLDGTGTTLNAGNRTWTLSGTGGNPFQLVGIGGPPDLVPSTSTFVYTGNNGSGDTTIQSETYNNLEINNAAETYVLEAATATGNGGTLTITAGTLDVTSSNYGLTIGGSYSNSGNFNSRTGTVTFNSTASGRTLGGEMTGSNDDFYNLVFNGVSGAWTFNAAVDVANDFTITNGSVTAGSNNLTVTRDFTLANTSGVNYVANSSTVTVSRHWDDAGGKFTHGTSTVSLNGTGTITVPWQEQFHNISMGSSGFTTTINNTALQIYNILTLNGGTVTRSGGNARFYLSPTSGMQPVVFSSPTTVTNVDWFFFAHQSTTLTVPGADYGTGNMFVFSYSAAASSTTGTYSIDGNITMTHTIGLGAENSTNTAVVNTNNHSVTASRITFGECLSWGCANPATLNLGSSTVTLSSTVTGLDVRNNAGSHTLNMGSATVDVKGNVTFVNGTGSVAVTPGTSTLKWTHSSGSKLYTPNSQSLYNLELNASGGTVLAAGAVDVNNSFTITAGTYDTDNFSNFALNVGGSFTNNGTFTARNATVTLDGTSEQNLSGTLTGSSAFYNLTVTNSSGTNASNCERADFVPSIDFDAAATVTNNTTFTTASSRIEFNSGSTYTMTNINWNGQATGTRLYFRNSAESGSWNLNVSGTQTAVSYINVSRSNASGGNEIVATDGTNLDCGNNTNWDFGVSTFEQADYRFGQPNGLDIDYTGAPAENTAYSTSGTGDDFRLRLLIHVGGNNLAQNGETFKLQYGEKTGATCTSGVSWGDVATGSGVIRYFDGGGRADGDNLTTNGGDPDHSGHTKVAQDYEEANNFTNSVAAINSGQDGLWDFSLQNHSAVGGKRYCFKAVKSTGTDLDSYTFYPEVIVDEELIFSLDSTSKSFGVVTPGANPTDVSSTLTTTTNSSTGYVVYAWATQVMTKGSDTLANWTGTNASPTTFGNGSFGFGYTTDDSSLTGGTANRFTNGGAKYAGFTHTGPGDPVADRTSGPVTAVNDVITYRLAASTTQAAGTYSTVIVYVCSVTF